MRAMSREILRRQVNASMRVALLAAGMLLLRRHRRVRAGYIAHERDRLRRVGLIPPQAGWIVGPGEREPQDWPPNWHQA